MSKNYVCTKSILRNVCMVACVLVCLQINVWAQGRTFNKMEFNALKQVAYEKLENITYRSTTVYQFFSSEGSNLNYYSKTTLHFIPPYNRHIILETKDANGLRTEQSIYAYGMSFRKYKDEDWEEIIGQGTGTGSGTGTGMGGGGEVRVTKTEEFNLEKDQLVNKQKTDLYQTIVTYKYKSVDLEYSTVDIKRYWFNKDEQFVKTEFITKKSNSEEFIQSTTVYEYDPKISFPLTPLKITSKPDVRFTDEARKNNITELMKLRVEFRANGTIGSVTPLKSLPDGLTEKAIAAAKMIKFVPATLNGKPLTVIRLIEYSMTVY